MVPVAPLVAAVPVAPAAFAPPPVHFAFLPAAAATCVIVPDLAVGEEPKLIVMVVVVWIVPTFCSVIHIEPCTPALAAPGSFTTALFGATVQVLPSESMTFVMSLLEPPAALLSAAIAIATVAPADAFDVGEHCALPAVLCVHVPRFVITSANA